MLNLVNEGQGQREENGSFANGLDEMFDPVLMIFFRNLATPPHTFTEKDTHTRTSGHTERDSGDDYRQIFKSDLPKYHETGCTVYETEQWWLGSIW